MPSKAAKKVSVSPHMVAYASEIKKHGISALVDAVKKGKLSMLEVVEIAKYTPEIQKELLAMIKSGEAKTVKKAIAIRKERHSRMKEDEALLREELEETEHKIGVLMEKREQLCKKLNIEP
jgi:hypothetical protein